MSRIEFVELSNRHKVSRKYYDYDEVIKETRYDLREALVAFLPEKVLDDVVVILKKHNILLRIETPRKEILGYCNRYKNIISINNDLDKAEFLRVFLHEYAHLLTHIIFLKATWHGSAFYYCFQELVLKFISQKIISKDLFLSIVNYDGDYEFYKKYDFFKFQLKEIRIGSQFIYQDQIIIRGKRRQGLIDCIRVSDKIKFTLGPETKILPVLDLLW